MTHINTEGKVVKMPKWWFEKRHERAIENFRKVFNNEMEYYEKNWPFYRPDTDLGKLVSLFWNFKIVRRFIGGTWVKGDQFGLWLKTNEHFDKKWLASSKHEIWP